MLRSFEIIYFTNSHNLEYASNMFNSVSDHVSDHVSKL